MLELVGPDGIVGVYEVGGRAAAAEYAPQKIGLTLEEGKHLLAALQARLVQAQGEDHSRHRRRCQRCGAQRPLKDQRSRRLVSLFGTVGVRAPRFTPCRCALTCRGRSTRLPRSCPTDARRSTSGPSQRWVRCYLTVGRGCCWRSFCHSASHRPWKPRGSEPFVLALGWSRRLLRGWDPSWRWPRNRLHSPLTAATCGRLVSIRGARSKFSSLRSATTRGSRSCSLVCRRRRLRRLDNCAVCFMG